MKTGRRLAVPVMMAALLACCTPQGADSTGGGRGGNAPPAPKSVLSAFLAGRLAQAEGDHRLAADYYGAALKFDPDNDELLLRTFTMALVEGRMEQSVALADHLLDFDTEAPLPLLVIGLRDARAGRFTVAENHFARLPKRGIFGILQPLLMAWTRFGQGKTDDALAALDQLDQIKGLGSVKAYHTALICDAAERTECAAKAYDQATSDQLAARMTDVVGSFYQRHGQLEKARDLYRQYTNAHPDTLLFDAQQAEANGMTRPVASAQSGLAEVMFDAAILLRQANPTDTALVFGRLALALQPDFPLAQMNVAEMLGQQNRMADSNAVYQSIKSNSPLANFGRLRIAMALDDLGQTEKALQELEALSKDPRLGTDALITMADLLRNRKRFDESAKAYSRVVDRLSPLPPQHWAVLFGRGICYERLQNWPQAEADFQHALELAPDQPDVMNYLGYSWVDQGIHLQEGRSLIEKAVALRPRDGAVVDSLGWALFRMGEFDKAVVQLERAVSLRPHDPTIIDHLGDAMWQVGRQREALYQWRRALSYDPEPDLLPVVKQKLSEREAEFKTLTGE